MWDITRFTLITVTDLRTFTKKITIKVSLFQSPHPMDLACRPQLESLPSRQTVGDPLYGICWIVVPQAAFTIPGGESRRDAARAAACAVPPKWQPTWRIFQVYW